MVDALRFTRGMGGTGANIWTKVSLRCLVKCNIRGEQRLVEQAVRIDAQKHESSRPTQTALLRSIHAHHEVELGGRAGQFFVSWKDWVGHEFDQRCRCKQT